jgi:uncharacterized protein (DUF1697 family)
MTVVISLLRGVNVGGHHLIPMDALRKLYESLGLRDPETYAQSGNVVFRSRDGNLDPLARRIENAIERKFGFRPDVMVRTCSEFRDVVARNPFARREGIEPGKLLVHFLAGDPGQEARDRVSAITPDAEELRPDGREVYIYFPNGMGRSKLWPGAIEKALGATGTGRNWNSVTKLLEIAEKLEASERRG